MAIFRIKRGVVRVYHTTRVDNLQSIFKYGLLLDYQKDRPFERESLGLDLKKKGVIYLSKSLDYLCIPAKENKRVVIQIDIPKSVYQKFESQNTGDPVWAEFHKRFNNAEDAAKFMFSEMRRQDPKLDQKVRQEIRQYGTLENTPRYKHAVASDIAMSPKYCLCISENIPPEWICSEVLTESQLRQMGKYAPHYD